MKIKIKDKTDTRWSEYPECVRDAVGGLVLEVVGEAREARWRLLANPEEISKGSGRLVNFPQFVREVALRNIEAAEWLFNHGGGENCPTEIGFMEGDYDIVDEGEN